MDILLWHKILSPYELLVQELILKFNHMKKEYREISAEEWDWFYEQVMRALYYHPEGGSRARERALRLYGECADAAWERMTAGRRLLCRYVYGIAPEHGMR